MENKENKENKENYDNIKLSDIYIPDEIGVVIEMSRLTSEYIEIATLNKKPTSKDQLDLIYTVVAIGPKVTKYQIGDKVIVRGDSTPIDLINDLHFQIEEFQILGKVTNPEYDKIKQYFSTKRSKEKSKIPSLIPSFIGGDGKVMFDAINKKLIN